MSTVNVVPVFFVIPILRAKRMKSHGYQYCKFTLHLRCYDSSWRYPWVASNIVCAREWVIFSIILCFTPHFQQFEKIEMTKDIYMYYIKINKTYRTWEKIWVTDLINLWEDCTFFNCSRLTTFFSLLPKKHWRRSKRCSEAGKQDRTSNTKRKPLQKQEWGTKINSRCIFIAWRAGVSEENAVNYKIYPLWRGKIYFFKAQWRIISLAIWTVLNSRRTIIGNGKK